MDRSDLSGHGLSLWQTTYSVGQLAADIAPLVRDIDNPASVVELLDRFPAHA